jgi:two-component system, chemotaxis family, protein-glutamate methylesterase/glutaminase
VNTRDIIVIGSSAGGLRALTTLFSALPGDLPASVFVVLHTAPQHPSILPSLLDRAGPMTVANAIDGERILPSRAYVAPPDRHLLLERGHMHLSAGPRENRARPAINPLFRSAALAYGPRVIGVVLTGLLDDGTLGLYEIKRRGGVSIVQEPRDAEYYQMPASAIRNVEVDYLIPLKEIASRLVALAGQPFGAELHESRFTMESEATGLTCPDCHGPLRRLRYGDVSELKCRVGHTYSPETAMLAHDEAEERILWSAVEMLEEGADFAHLLAESLHHTPAELEEKIVLKRRLAQRLRSEIEAAVTAVPVPEKHS